MVNWLPRLVPVEIEYSSYSRSESKWIHSGSFLNSSEKKLPSWIWPWIRWADTDIRKSSSMCPSKIFTISGSLLVFLIMVTVPGSILFCAFLIHTLIRCYCESHSVMSNSLRPHRLCSPWNSPGQNTGVGSRSLLQGIFPTQGSNTGLPHCRWFFTSWATREPLQGKSTRANQPTWLSTSNLEDETRSVRRISTPPPLP